MRSQAELPFFGDNLYLACQHIISKENLKYWEKSQILRNCIFLSYILCIWGFLLQFRWQEMSMFGWLYYNGFAPVASQSTHFLLGQGR